MVRGKEGRRRDGETTWENGEGRGESDGRIRGEGKYGRGERKGREGKGDRRGGNEIIILRGKREGEEKI